jgi:hypothetical protein
MKAATARDEPEPFSQPTNVKGVAICRLSGKLATDGCRNAWSTTPEGLDVQRSMEYTEYFVDGTEPVEFCPFHANGGFDEFSVVGTSGFRDVPAVPVSTPAIAEPPAVHINAPPPREAVIPDRPVDPPSAQAPPLPKPPPSSQAPVPEPPPTSQTPPSPTPPPASQTP